jgi:hypothetical protein
MAIWSAIRGSLFSLSSKDLFLPKGVDGGLGSGFSFFDMILIYHIKKILWSELMTISGFKNIEYAGPTGIATSRFNAGALFRGRKNSGNKL